MNKWKGPYRVWWWDDGVCARAQTEKKNARPLIPNFLFWIAFNVSAAVTHITQGTYLFMAHSSRSTRSIPRFILVFSCWQIVFFTCSLDDIDNESVGRLNQSKMFVYFVWIFSFFFLVGCRLLWHCPTLPYQQTGYAYRSVLFSEFEFSLSLSLSCHGTL